MIMVDSSVWIDYFRNTVNPQTDLLDALLGQESVLTGDLILIELLQGFPSLRDFKQARRLLSTLPVIELAGQRTAIAGAKNFRLLRSLGLTPRGTIDTLIATKCIERGYALLHNDRDFFPFVTHLGLVTVL